MRLGDFDRNLALARDSVSEAGSYVDEAATSSLKGGGDVFLSCGISGAACIWGDEGDEGDPFDSVGG